MKVDTIIFDLYGTLINHKKRLQPYKKLFRELKLNNEEITNAIYLALTQDFKDLSKFVSEIKHNAKFDIKKYQNLIEEDLTYKVPYEESFEVLEKLKQQNYKIGLLSNTSTPYKDPFYKLGFEKFFNEITFSCDVNFKKDEDIIYYLTIKKLDSTPNRTLMIGDNYRYDYKKPIDLGINATYLNRDSPSNKGIFNLNDIFELNILERFK